MDETPASHLEARLNSALLGLQKLARIRGLEDVYAMELFSIQLTVQEALDSQARGLVEHAREAVRMLEAQVRETPAKPAPGRRTPETGR